jgi:branched-chain amino acid transport system ATP-binding protein
MNLPALEISDLHAWYGTSHILYGVDMRVDKGEVAALVGRAGAGRTTTLRAIVGRTCCREGSVRIHGTEAIDLPAHKIAHLGVGYCPEEGNMFANLSCEENLLLPPPTGALGGGMSLVEIYEIFPNFYEGRHVAAARLSEDEQQMLAVARLLRTGATLLLLDCVFKALTPLIVHALRRMFTALKQRGYTILMVERHFPHATPLADRFYVMARGQIVERFEASELPEKRHKLHELLGG